MVAIGLVGVVGVLLAALHEQLTTSRYGGFELNQQVAPNKSVVIDCSMSYFVWSVIIYFLHELVVNIA